MGLSWVKDLPLRDPVSSLTHLSWCVFSIFTAVLLWRLARGDRLKQLTAGCFGLCMCMLYLASGVYHAVVVPEPTLQYFRLADHTAIYLLIAGTATPVFALLLHGRQRLFLLTLVWTLAAAGIACKWLIPAPPDWITVSLYVALGWVGLLPAAALTRTVGWRGVAWAVAGGILYTAGAVCDAAGWPVIVPNVIRPHEVHHLFDMGGTFAHVVFIIGFVLPFQRLPV